MGKLFVLTLAVLALGLAACSGGAPSAASGAQEFSIEASEFKFQPATIELASGRPVKIVLRNKGALEHDWAIMKIAIMGMQESSTGSHDMGHASDKPDLHVNAMMGQMAQVEFTPTEKGTYQFFCTVAGHKEAGMVGSLIVK